MENEEKPKHTELLPGDAVQSGARILGEAAIPGASLYLDGNLKEGLAHTVLGMAAGAVFGLPGMLFVAANSFSRSRSGKNIHEHVLAARK